MVTQARKVVVSEWFGPETVNASLFSPLPWQKSRPLFWTVGLSGPSQRSSIGPRAGSTGIKNPVHGVDACGEEEDSFAEERMKLLYLAKRNERATRTDDQQLARIIEHVSQGNKNKIFPPLLTIIRSLRVWTGVILRKTGTTAVRR